MKLCDETIGMEETFELQPAVGQGKTWGAAAGKRDVSYRNLLVPLDYSDCAKLTRSTPAVAIARDFGSKLRLVHVLEPSGFFTGEQPALQRPRPKILQNLKSNLAAYAYENIDEAHPTGLCLSHGPELQQRSAGWREEQKNDLIVISTHGRGGLGHAMLGSTAEQVVRQGAVFRAGGAGRRKQPEEIPPEKYSGASGFFGYVRKVIFAGGGTGEAGWFVRHAAVCDAAAFFHAGI